MPRRQRGEGAVFQRSDGYWVARVDLGIIDGKPKRKTAYAKTQAGAVKKLAALKKAVDAGDRTTAGTTVAKWMTTWLDDVCPTKVKPGTLATYRSHTERHIVPAIGRVKLDRLDIQHVRELHASVARKGLSQTTALHAHRILATALSDAMREGKVTRNVATLTGAPKVIAPPQHALSLAEARAVFATVDGTRLQARWEMALTTGARQGECLGLEWERVDLNAGTADLAWQLQRIRYRHGCGGGCGFTKPDRCPLRELDVHPGFEFRRLDGNLCLQRPKTYGSTRVVALMPALVDSLRRRATAGEPNPHGLVFTRPDGRPIDGRRDYAEWQQILTDSGVPAMPLHAARHSTGTILQALGVSEAVRMAIMGHSEAATARRYAHVDLTLQREAMQSLAAALGR